MLTRFYLFILCSMLLPISATAGETGALRISQDLFEKKEGTVNVATLEVGEVVDIIRRAGHWFEIRTATGKRGWIPLSSLRLNVNGPLSPYINTVMKKAATADAAGEGIEVGERPTEAMRGLSHGKLDASNADPDAVKDLENYAVEKTDAKIFATDLGLKATRLDYLMIKQEPARKQPASAEEAPE